MWFVEGRLLWEEDGGVGGEFFDWQAVHDVLIDVEGLFIFCVGRFHPLANIIFQDWLLLLVISC